MCRRVPELADPKGRRIVGEEELRLKVIRRLRPLNAHLFDFVTGPGRSGAIAAVYASHYLHIPYIPHKATRRRDSTVLVIDTASLTGNTLRKAASWYGKRGCKVLSVALYSQPPRVKFWYEFWPERDV